MAISPKDLILTDTELAEVMQLEEAIDEGVRRQFVKSEVELVVGIGERSMSPRIREELVRRYKNAGWSRVDVTTHGYPKFILGMR